MKIKTSKASGGVLDWTVAKCEGEDALAQFHSEVDWFCPSDTWAHGGPIVERERICIDIGHDGVWLAYSKQNYGDDKEFMHSGPTALIAAMRCYVASKWGDEIETPDELI